MAHKKTNKKTAKLRVESIVKSRSGRSLCYIDQQIMSELVLNTRDIIEIRGKKKTTGIAVASATDGDFINLTFFEIFFKHFYYIREKKKKLNI